MKLVLHPSVESRFARIVARPNGTYLLSGPAGIGKATTARELARQLNCHHLEVEPCSSCLQVASGNHAQITIIAPRDKPSIGIERIRELKAELALARYDGRGRRVIIIDGADRLTLEAQNAMLKLMEEPPEATVIILVAESPDKLLPTVRSRCESVIFSTPDETATLAWLGQQGSTPLLAERAVALAAGLPGRALTLLRDSAELEVEERYTTIATELVEQSIFERFIQIRLLSDEKVVFRRVIESLEQQVHLWLRQSQDVARQVARLQAIETTYLRLDANVTPRLAMEALVLEL